MSVVFEKPDYLFVLKAVQELPFGVGRNLLIDFLQGSEDNDSIKKHRLDKLSNYGTMSYGRGELNSMIGTLLMKGLLDCEGLESNKFCKVLKITEKGKRELKEPTIIRKESFFSERQTDITLDERKLFSEFDFFLSSYNDEQKKAIVSAKEKILCVAGAGSGKTTVLTKRIEFLARFRSVAPEKILAITFTRKARQEMMKRLHKEGLSEVRVETFNSFCEKTLKANNALVYDKPVRVMTYSDKIRIIKSGLVKLNLGMEQAISRYFKESQKRGKTDEQLMNIFMNDCFFITDYFKFKGRGLDQFNLEAGENHANAKMVQAICMHIEESCQRQGLRDYADQLLDAIRLFREHPEVMPGFEHILIDEYQDVNSTQIMLVKLLDPKNIFCVGDPRQSIYGWRGSDISYILKFEEEYPGCEIINLTKNYRSTSHIVELINEGISHMRLPDLQGMKEGEKDMRLLEFASEQAEYEFVIQRILASDIPKNEIFVLARTNKQLSELSLLMKERGIKHVVKNEESEANIFALEEDVTLATVHAIKGLEAEMVFVIGCTTNNFPCKGSEHPVVEMIKVDEYDKEAEERRLFYVAMSRSRQSLYLSYVGKSMTGFISRKMIEMIDPEHESLKQKKLFDFKEERKESGETKGYKEKKLDGPAGNAELISRLQDWRREKSQELGVPAFMIMHDKTLHEIADKMPLQQEELEDIHGLGPAKIRRYGAELIRLICR
jgi:superfamily I DNA/RNA helicase